MPHNVFGFCGRCGASTDLVPSQKTMYECVDRAACDGRVRENQAPLTERIKARINHLRRGI